MPRAPTTLDPFNALGEPRRRTLLETLALGTGQHDVTSLVNRLAWPQPQISKHLGVLRTAGLVTAEKRGRRRVYSVNPQSLRTVFEWVGSFERLWTHQLDRIKQRAEREQRATEPLSTSKPRKAPAYDRLH